MTSSKCLACWTRNVYIDREGKKSAFCSLSCRDNYKCSFCKLNKVWIDNRTNIPSPWCSKTCRDNSRFVGAPPSYGVPASPSNPGPKIVLMDPRTPKYQDIVNQFTKKWLHPASERPRPSIERIFRIHPESGIVSRYETYKRNIELFSGPFQGHRFNGRAMEAGNEQRRFHGTMAKCSIGLAPSNTTLCNTQGCRICSILRTSFKTSCGGRKLRYGAGLYFSSTSSKSDEYAGDGVPYNGVTYKVMFLCKVVVGKGSKPPTDMEFLTAPPPGYNSVIGEPDNEFDEVVVYDDAACYPAYLIVYKTSCSLYPATSNNFIY